MNEQMLLLTQQIKALEADLEAEIAKSRAGLRFGLERGKAIFDEEVLRRHRELKTSLTQYILKARPLIVLTAPVIYSLIVPIALLDLFVTVYQAVCFPAYGIEKVKRSDYLVFDRRYLAYLNALEMLNCAYCSYANGVIAFTREVAGRTERYWCPIKHARRVLGAHPHYSEFVDYGDAEAFQRDAAALAAGNPAPPDAPPNA